MFRVIWQYETRVLGDLRAEAIPESRELVERHPEVFSDLPIMGEAEPVFTQPATTLRAETLALPKELVEAPELDFATYQHAFVGDEAAAQELVARLSNTAGVRYAEVQPKLDRPVHFHDAGGAPSARLAALTLPLTATPPLEAEQRYLDPAPAGIDARFAWGFPGGRGEGLRIVDIEDGWNFHHEDLRLLQGGVIFGASSVDDHGTAVLGIFSGDENRLGVTGIASRATALAAAATYDPILRKWNAANAIKQAADRLRPGDAILLEMHGPGPNSAPGTADDQKGFVPVEYWQAEFAAIQYATAKRIYVIEAAGNGGENLDAPIYAGRFDRNRRDSGAIMVGGGGSALSPAPRARWVWSNYGSRLDVQGWGDSIVTTGGTSRPEYHDRIASIDPDLCYTKSFGGTSGASPIVTGAVAVISGCLKAANRPLLSPAMMRQLLVRTGSRQTDVPGPVGIPQIGPLPNVQVALRELGFE